MKPLLWLYILLILAGCTDMLIEDISTHAEKEFYATIEGSNSRTYVDGQIRLRWTADDRVTVFKKTTYNREFMFTGVTGANAGGFKQKSVDDDFWYGADVPYNYAVYPHSPTIQLDETDHFFTLTMPSEQTYVENSFGLGANTMVAVSESGQLMFKNVGSYLRVRLYGKDVAVSSITLTSRGNEAIAGKAKVIPNLNGNPTCEMLGTSKSIRLTCPEPVSISEDSDNPTDFWIVVPSVKLSKGFTVTVANDKGDTQVFEVTKPFTFERNLFTNMKRETLFKEEVPNNQLWYTSTTGKIITFNNANFGDATIVSNEIINGKGIATFDREISILGDYLFANLEELESITLPNCIKTIGNSTFSRCKNLSCINLPNSIESIGEWSFFGCVKLSEISIPNKIVSINDYAFYGCDNLISVDLSNNITSIGKCAFGACGKLKHINFPNGIKSIGNEAFYDCVSLMSIEIPSSVMSIGLNPFHGCKKLVSIKVDENNSFYDTRENCNAIIESPINRLISSPNSTIIPNSVTSIGKAAFRGNDMISINLPDNIISIEAGAFAACTNLTSINIPNGVTSIESSTFSSCSSLTSIDLPKSITSIGERAFVSCINLSSINIPKGVTFIGEYAFENCESLTSINIPETVSVINSYSFRNCINLTKLNISEGVSSIEAYSFYNCINLVSINIPNSITAFGREAFAHCHKIKSINIPLNTGTIWSGVFWNCNSLQEIHCKATKPPMKNGTIVSDPTKITLYVPQGSLSLYKMSSYWTEFINIIEE